MVGKAGYCPTPVRKSVAKKKAADEAGRAQWKRQKKPQAQVQKPAEDEEDEDDEETKTRTKRGQKEDWNLLKQTLRHGGDDSGGDNIS